MWKEFGPYLLPLALVLIVARRSLRARRIRPSRLWIAPAYIALAMALTLALSPMPSLFTFLLFAGAAALGVGVGYLSARHREFSLDPKTGAIMSKSTPVGMFLFLGLFVVRFGLGYYMRGGTAPGAVQGHSAELVAYTDAALFFALAMVSASAWEIWRRTRPLLASAAPAAPEAPPAPGPLL